MLIADKISVRFGDECVLDRFSCHVAKGTFACITGMSGCGKTSLLKSFLGITPVISGVIKVDGKVLNEQTCGAIRKCVAYLPQDLALPYGSVEEAIRQILKVGGLKYTQTAMPILREYLAKLGLEEEMLDKRVAEISGGQRQRLMLAMLALLDREVWLLDEPTASLDKMSRDYVIDFLLEQQQRGKTIVAVSHDPCFAAKCTETIHLC